LAILHGGAGHFSGRHADYSRQKRREAEFIDSKGASADLGKSVATADTRIELDGPNLGTTLSRTSAPGFGRPLTPLKVLSSVRRENLSKTYEY
jgi:hypothetical protein